MCHHPSLARRRALTLVETLVVIGLSGLLLSLLLVAIQRLRETANRLACQSNLRQIGLAVTMFHDDHGHTPPSTFFLYEPPDQPSRHPFVYLPWMTNLLPYIGEDGLWRDTLAAMGQTTNTLRNPPHRGLTTIIKLYRCPSDPRLNQTHVDGNGVEAAFTSYMGVRGGAIGSAGAGDGLLSAHSLVRLGDAHDGLSWTLLAGERPPPDTFQAGWWYTSQGSLRFTQRRGPEATMPVLNTPFQDPNCRGPSVYGPGRTDNPCDRYHFWSLHSGGANFVFGDSSVRFLAWSARRILPALGTKSGGEIVELPE